MRRLEIMETTKILRYKQKGYFTYHDISNSVGCFKTTAREILSRCNLQIKVKAIFINLKILIHVEKRDKKRPPHQCAGLIKGMFDYSASD